MGEHVTIDGKVRWSDWVLGAVFGVAVGALWLGLSVAFDDFISRNNVGGGFTVVVAPVAVVCLGAFLLVARRERSADRRRRRNVFATMAVCLMVGIAVAQQLWFVTLDGLTMFGVVLGLVGAAAIGTVIIAGAAFLALATFEAFGQSRPSASRNGTALVRLLVGGVIGALIGIAVLAVLAAAFDRRQVTFGGRDLSDAEATALIEQADGKVARDADEFESGARCWFDEIPSGGQVVACGPTRERPTDEWGRRPGPPYYRVYGARDVVGGATAVPELSEDYAVASYADYPLDLFRPDGSTISP